MRIKITIFFLLIVTSFLSGQMKRCTTFKQAPLSFNETAFSRSNDIIFPLVFHIIEGPDSPRLSNEKILELVEVLNKDFNTSNSGIPQELAEISSTAGQVGFQFKLAEINPQGQQTGGIIRRESKIQNIGNQLFDDRLSFVKSDEEGGSTAWDIENYINIWIAERTISLGASVAENTITKDQEGIVLAYDAVFEFPKTISHEMGHYFGLLHPWGNETGCDQEDDDIADTPFQSAPNFRCELMVNCEAIVTVGNIMDFGPDECLLYFTKLQAQYMQNFVAEFKAELLDSDDCFFDNMAPSAPDISWNFSNSSLQIYPDNTADLERIILYELSGKVLRLSEVKSQEFLNLPLPGIPPGIYLLRFQGESFDFTKKIMLGL